MADRNVPRGTPEALLKLETLSIRDLRCIEVADLELGPELTLISGPNGSGKTSLLEAIFLLGRGRSFRTRNSERLIRRGEHRLHVVGHVANSPEFPSRPVGIEVGPEGTVARVGGQAVASLAELSRTFAVQAIDPGVHRLLEEGGHRRRRWMDWGVFHVEPAFADAWQRYTRALKQRNAALRTHPEQALLFDAELARTGELIAQLRERHAQALQPLWREVVTALTGLDVDLGYLRGWPTDRTLSEALEASRSRDELRKLTHSGPHRADISLRLGHRPARDVLSRGQQKLVAVAMNLAQLRLLQELTGITPTLLLDDPGAELDDARLRLFIEQVIQLRSQLIMTSLSSESRLFGTPERTFHMDQGRVQPV